MARRLLLSLVVAALLGCTRAPYTNRSQLMLISSDEEVKLGTQAFQEVLAKSPIDKDPKLLTPVEEVGRRIAEVANQPNYRWQFVVIDDPKQVNAFALPGGKVAVYTGLFPVAQDTNGLAVVLGHEIAHAIAHHGAERVSQSMAAEAGANVLGAVVGGGVTGSAVLAAYGLGTQVGVLLPFSRTQESEADHIGLMLMARAGYDPRGALAFWKRMERAGDGKTPEFLSTHPSHGTREEQIAKWLPEAEQAYQASGQRAAVAPLPKS